MKYIKAIAIPIVVLAALGFALAMWSETLKLNVTVQTGEVDVAFIDYFCSDTGSDPQAPEFSNEEGKNVATCVVEPETHDDEDDVIKLKVIINNTYPGYTVDITLVVKNTGTIPVKLYTSTVTFAQPISAQLIRPEDTQIEPGETSTYTLRITIPQEASELTTYVGEVELVFAQWNEVS